MTAPPKTVLVACAHCSKQFHRTAKDLRANQRKGQTIYCSVACLGLARKTGRRSTHRGNVAAICQQCGVDFFIYRSQKNSGRKFCSRACAYTGSRRSLDERFFKLLATDHPEGCWVWTAATTQWGYGVLGKAEPNGRIFLAHRFSYEKYVGPIPPGKFVLHKCDRPACCNPTHLFLGTAADNTADMIAKRRNRFIGEAGEKNGQARLTSAAVQQIRKSREPAKILATKFGVSRTTVRRAQKGELWKHVT